jgi:hypothetical protein
MVRLSDARGAGHSVMRVSAQTASACQRTQFYAHRTLPPRAFSACCCALGRCLPLLFFACHKANSLAQCPWARNRHAGIANAAFWGGSGHRDAFDDLNNADTSLQCVPCRTAAGSVWT